MKIHIVKKGDTLYELAQKYHIELDKLIAANPQISDPNVLDIGMKVKIPHSPKPVMPPTDYLYKHVVVQGDSLWKLGKAWGVPLADMIAANPQLKNPNVLMTGEVIYIPKLNTEPSKKPVGGANVKADTSQIVPEAPLPMEAPPVSEQAVEQPNIMMQEVPAKENPNVPQAQALPEQPNIMMQEAPAKEKPNVPQAQALPEQPNIMMQEAPAKEKPNVPQAQALPEQPNIMMQEAPAKENPYVPQMQAFPQMQALEQPNIPQIHAIPQMPNIGMMQAPGKEQPNISPFQTIPPMPYMGIQQAPAVEIPYASPSFGVPHLPNTMPAQTAMESNEPFGMHEAVLPYYMTPHPNWQTGVHPMEGVNVPPSEELFQQYNVPATEVMAYDMELSKGKEKENEWKQPEHLSMPSMQTMAATDAIPMLPNLPTSAEMPYFAPHAAYPPLPEMELSHMGGGCGCGQLNLPYALPMAAGYPGVPAPEETFMPYPFHPHGTPMMPYAAGGYPSYEAMAAVNAYPGISPYAGMTGPGAPFSVPYPWAAPVDHGPHDLDQSKGGKGKSREEKAEVAQTEPQPAPKRSAASKKKKSARATISSLLKRHAQRTQKTEKVRKASPWMNH